MMTAEERIASLHQRMEARRRRRERRQLNGLRVAPLALTACLAALLVGNGMGHGGAPAGAFTGATMLFENAGGYVLVAVAAFMLGVVITVVCLRRNRSNPKK